MTSVLVPGLLLGRELFYFYDHGNYYKREDLTGGLLTILEALVHYHSGRKHGSMWEDTGAAIKKCILIHSQCCFAFGYF